MPYCAAKSLIPLDKWPMPNNQYAQEHFHCAYIWRQCVSDCCKMGFGRNLLIGMKRAGYDDPRVSRYVFEHQPCYRSCKVCGNKIVNFLNYGYCAEHLHLTLHRADEKRRLQRASAIRSRTMREHGTISA